LLSLLSQANITNKQSVQAGQTVSLVGLLQKRCQGSRQSNTPDVEGYFEQVTFWTVVYNQLLVFL
jgi:hypothetical protein